jgi:ribosomal-protein-alanine N-acetyltransferase
MSALEIRPALADDLPRLAELERSGFEAAWAATALGEALATEHALALVAAPGAGDAIGFALFLRCLDEAELLRVAVAPEMRRQGVGAALVAEGLRRLDALGVRRCSLEVRPSNLAARGLYERLGFQPAGRRRAYYADGEDALVYALERAVVG